jgi:predicted nucleic acid-binding protein
MDVILDMNVLMSALIRESYTSELVLKVAKAGHRLWIPEAAAKKLMAYRKYISRRKGCPPADVDALIRELLTHLNILPHARISAHIPKAKAAMDSIDPEDSIFVACALSLPGSVIWSNDKHLKKQGLARIYTTDELLKAL